MADVDHALHHVLLTLERRHGVGGVEGVLLQDDEVDQLRLPERHVVIHRHTVVTQDVDLLRDFLAAQHTRLHLVYHAEPFGRDVLRDIGFKLGVLQVFRIAVDRVDGRVTLAVSTCLLKGVETTCHLFRVLRHRLFQVTTRRRHRTDERHRTGLSIIQHHHAGASVEVGHDRRQVHRESVRSRQLFESIGHLAERLCPARCGVCHKQHLQPHAAVIFCDSHGRVDRCLTRSHGHVRGVGDDDRALHQLAARVRIDQLGELYEDLHHLIGTFAAGRDDHNVRLGLLRDGVLKHRLARSERPGDEARATLDDRVHRVDDAHTCFEQLVRPRLLLVTRDSALHRPFLDHRYLMLRALFVRQHGDGVRHGILARSYHRLHLICTLKLERYHDAVRLCVLFHLAEPCAGLDRVASLSQRLEVPQPVVVERVGVFAASEEDAVHLVQIVLQPVVVAREHARPERHL